MCIYNRILWIKMLCISPTMWYGFAQRKMRFNATENSPNNKWVQPSYTTNSAWNITDHQQSTSPDTAERPENWSPWIQNWLEKWFSKGYVILQVLFVLFVLFVRFLVSTGSSRLQKSFWCPVVSGIFWFFRDDGITIDMESPWNPSISQKMIQKAAPDFHESIIQDNPRFEMHVPSGNALCVSTPKKITHA